MKHTQYISGLFYSRSHFFNIFVWLTRYVLLFYRRTYLVLAIFIHQKTSLQSQKQAKVISNTVVHHTVQHFYYLTVIAVFNPFIHWARGYFLYCFNSVPDTGWSNGPYCFVETCRMKLWLRQKLIHKISRCMHCSVFLQHQDFMHCDVVNMIDW